jgi:pilus assembly protein CpaE
VLLTRPPAADSFRPDAVGPDVVALSLQDTQMGQTVRVIVVNTDEGVASDLRAVLLSIDGVKIVAEVDEPALLAQTLDSIPAEVLLVHLDPNPAGIMDVVAPLIEPRKERFAAIGMTEDRNAELVMRAMRAGMREFLWKPFPPEQLAEVLARVATQTDAAGRRLGQLITVVGACGGVGATSLATNLGVEMSQIEGWGGTLPDAAGGARPKVAVVDLDFRFGQVAMYLDAQPTYTVAELCETSEAIDTQMIERAMFKHATGLHVLSRPTDFSQAERISAAQCAGAMAVLQEHYDFVVVDMPARFDPSARAVFDMADTYLMVTQLLVPCVRNTDRILQELLRSGYASERIRLVVTRAGRDSGYLEVPDVETTLKRRVDFLVPDDWRTSCESVNMGAPLLVHAPKSRLRAAYQKMAQALAGLESTPAEGDEPNGKGRRKSLFGLFAGAQT